MDAIQEVIRQFKLDAISVEDVPESYSSTVARVALANGEKVYVKIPYSRLKLNREREHLERLAGILPTPRLLNFWEGNESINGAFLLEAIEGDPCDTEIETNLAYDIGRHHAALHSVPVSLYDDSEHVLRFSTGEWRPYMKKKFDQFVRYAEPLLPERLFIQSLDYFEKQIANLPIPDQTCLIHADFRPGNILVREGKVSGILDFESALIGSPENDFTKINRDILSSHPDVREAYEAGYRSVRPLINLDIYLPFYTFFDAFCSVGWSGMRGVEKHMKFNTENQVILRDVLEKR